MSHLDCCNSMQQLFLVADIYPVPFLKLRAASGESRDSLNRKTARHIRSEGGSNRWRPLLSRKFISTHRVAVYKPLKAPLTSPRRGCRARIRVSPDAAGRLSRLGIMVKASIKDWVSEKEYLH